jgi:hypothetical protein
MIEYYGLAKDIKNRTMCFAWIDKFKKDKETANKVKKVLSENLLSFLPSGVTGRELLSVGSNLWLDSGVIKQFATWHILPNASRLCSLVVPEGSVSSDSCHLNGEDVYEKARDGSLVFIPLHTQSHYGLIVVDLKQESMYILDTFAAPQPDVISAYKYVARRIQEHPELSKLKCYWPTISHGQKDSVSCGVFVILFMEEFARGDFDAKKQYIKSNWNAVELKATRWRIMRSLALHDSSVIV